MNTLRSSTPFVGRVLVVADRGRLAPWLREQYSGIDIAAAPSFMSGIAELANGPVHAVVACVDPAFAALDRAVRALRSALGQSVPLILCCAPEAEPMARQALAAGASDYVIEPPQPDELGRLLALAGAPGESFAPPPQTTLDEMQSLGKVLESMSSVPQRLLHRAAELLTIALSARAAVVCADGAEGHFGDEMTLAVLREPILKNGAVLGEIRIGESQRGGYHHGDVDKLRYYGEVLGHILHAARKQHEWQHLAMTDELSALPNRRFLLQFLDRILDRAARERFRVTLCMFDIDDFKRYNDEFGHGAGDEIIQATGQLLRRHCRMEDVVARYGGDEFVVVFWDAENPRVAGSQHPHEAMEVMKRFQEALRQHEFGCLGPKAKGALTISGGLATYPWDATMGNDLLKKADEALREAKRSGKNSVRLIGATATV